jgi:hypothetical protein
MARSRAVARGGAGRRDAPGDSRPGSGRPRRRDRRRDRRESYSNRFATALEGIDIDNPGTALDRSGHPNPVPRIAGRIRRARPVLVEDVTFLRAHTTRTIKMTVPGPFTMSQQAQNDHYPSEEERRWTTRRR